MYSDTYTHTRTYINSFALCFLYESSSSLIYTAFRGDVRHQSLMHCILGNIHNAISKEEMLGNRHIVKLEYKSHNCWCQVLACFVVAVVNIEIISFLRTLRVCKKKNYVCLFVCARSQIYRSHLQDKLATEIKEDLWKEHSVLASEKD